MSSEFPCDYCGVIYSNEDSTLQCPECETRWCSSCTQDTFCPQCAGPDHPLTKAEEAALTDPGDLLPVCPTCDEPVLTWPHISVFNDERTIETLCVVCGHCHETKTEKIKGGA